MSLPRVIVSTGGGGADVPLPGFAKRIVSATWAGPEVRAGEETELQALILGFAEPPQVSFEVHASMRGLPSGAALATVEAEVQDGQAKGSWTPPTDQDLPDRLVFVTRAGSLMRISNPVRVVDAWIREATWDPPEAGPGEPVSLRVDVTGFAAGKTVSFKVFRRNPGGDTEELETLDGGQLDAEGKAHADWTLPAGEEGGEEGGEGGEEGGSGGGGSGGGGGEEDPGPEHPRDEEAPPRAPGRARQRGTYHFVVEVEGGLTAESTLAMEEPSGRLHVQLVGEDGGRPLPGYAYEIKGPEGEGLDVSGRTNDDGLLLVEDVPITDFVLKVKDQEVGLPVLRPDHPEPHVVRVIGEPEAEEEEEVEKPYHLAAQFFDRTGREPAANLTFDLDDGREGTTDGDGVARLDRFPQGDIHLRFEGGHAYAPALHDGSILVQVNLPFVEPQQQQQQDQQGGAAEEEDDDAPAPQAPTFLPSVDDAEQEGPDEDDEEPELTGTIRPAETLEERRYEYFKELVTEHVKEIAQDVRSINEQWWNDYGDAHGKGNAKEDQGRRWRHEQVKALFDGGKIALGAEEGVQWHEGPMEINVIGLRSVTDWEPHEPQSGGAGEWKNDDWFAVCWIDDQGARRCQGFGGSVDPSKMKKGNTKSNLADGHYRYYWGRFEKLGEKYPNDPLAGKAARPHRVICWWNDKDDDQSQDEPAEGEPFGKGEGYWIGAAGILLHMGSSDENLRGWSRGCQVFTTKPLRPGAGCWKDFCKLVEKSKNKKRFPYTLLDASRLPEPIPLAEEGEQDEAEGEEASS